MAGVDLDSYEGGFAQGARLGRTVNLIGGACSVALIVGLGIWGYKLALRDVTGIPVFRAVEGPLRVAPKDPGGAVTMHQGLSVNAVAAAGTALPLPETLTLAPRGVELDPTDPAGLADLPMEAGSTPSLDPMIDAAMLAPQDGGMAPVETETDAVAAALAEALADGAAPLSELAPADDLAMVEPAPVEAAPVADIKRPRARPDTLAAVSAPVAVAASTAPAPAEVDPAAVPAGTAMVQLGAFDDQDTARGEWARLSGKFGDLMAGKSLVVQAAQSGGRTFYRLRAMGFATEDDSRQFCTALLKGNATCIPVLHR